MPTGNEELHATQTEPTILCLGVSHQTAPVAVREHLAGLPADWLTFARRLWPSLHEHVLLATCNRWELFVAVDAPAQDAEVKLFSLLATASDLPVEALRSHTYVWHGADAARHLCRVAAGLESLILGEAQILGQVSTAYGEALESGTVGPILSSLFRTAVRVGKRARTETAISARAATMSSVALSMAESLGGNLRERAVLVIGAGEMVQLALKALHGRRVGAVTIANRTQDRADALLLESGWRAVGLHKLDEELRKADVIFSATRAPHLLITADMLAEGQAETDRPKLLIDLAVPRDIDPAVRSLPNATLIDVDDLQIELDQGLTARRLAVPAAQQIVDDELATWAQEQRQLALRPLVVELRQKAEQIRQQEVERTLRFLGEVDESTRDHIHHLSRSLVNKLLHEPTVGIKSLAKGEDAHFHALTIRTLFGLNHHPEPMTSDSGPSC